MSEKMQQIVVDFVPHHIDIYHMYTLCLYNTRQQNVVAQNPHTNPSAKKVQN